MRSKIDPEEERQRLARVYAEMPDLQLEELAVEAESLTDPARDALRAEIARRNLDTALQVAHPTADHPAQSYVMVRSFRDLPLAELARAALEAEGIECFLFDDNTISMDWFYSYAIGGVKLLVREEDAVKALEILNQPPAEVFETDTGEYKQPSCPRCGSKDALYRGLQKRVVYAALLANLPIPIHYLAWKCNSCGNAWEESENEGGPEGLEDSEDSPTELP
jgi:DNA-directed RNA polymerase subunit M/transcription elongation factor TFIIS